jgi:Cupredoxin-like domain
MLNRGRRMIKALGLAALLAALALPGSSAQAAPGARAVLTITGTGAPPPAADRDRAGRPAVLTLQARPRRPHVGEQVTLSLADPPAGATDYIWDLTGNGVYAPRPGLGAEAQTVFGGPGAHAVGVRITVGGLVRQGELVLIVQPAPATGSRPVVRLHVARTARRRGRFIPAPPARLAGDPGVTIADFHFTPSATTVHLGDTITWTNNGPSSHTATAGNGSFNTGILKPGQSASHTFTQAGTFTYDCQIHPFMHGTIVVLASTTTTTSTSTQTSAPASAPTTAGSTTADTTTAGSTTAGSTTADTTTAGSATAGSATAGSATASDTSTTAAAAAGGQPTLPLTGVDVLPGLVAGLVLIGLGVTLRRTLAR